MHAPNSSRIYVMVRFGCDCAGAEHFAWRYCICAIRAGRTVSHKLLLVASVVKPYCSGVVPLRVELRTDRGLFFATLTPEMHELISPLLVSTDEFNNFTRMLSAHYPLHSVYSITCMQGVWGHSIRVPTLSNFLLRPSLTFLRRYCPWRTSQFCQTTVCVSHLVMRASYDHRARIRLCWVLAKSNARFVPDPLTGVALFSGALRREGVDARVGLRLTVQPPAEGSPTITGTIFLYCDDAMLCATLKDVMKSAVQA
jgi:hypothetical protein